MSDRDYVNPDDIRTALFPCLAHRLTLTAEAALNGRVVSNIIAEAIRQTGLPGHEADKD